MIAGAALQKDSQAVKYESGQKTNIKCCCFTCGAHGTFTAHQVREGLHPCRCGAGLLMPAAILACMELAPDHLADHPDLADASAHVGAMPSAGEPCGYCDHPMAPHLDRTYWYCRKCGHVNEEQPDGTVGVFRAAPFSAEVEQANALAGKRAHRVAVPVMKHRERVSPMSAPADLPF